ncbi:DAK2 domain-containing protein [Aeribacillus sp. FSL M8-0235]|uniref:DAK2 domain-containing protein n=1 Tax=Aeribacillus sp. FSL M8-0235 TaxID=2954576 RepID=UPI002870C92B|nr:DAK2 domain-containing protein [Aeribacillus pallidus]
MANTLLDGKRFAEMVIQGANHLSNNAKVVDALNVFPVPDGDTGTNMNLSITAGAKEVQKHVSSNIGSVAGAFAKGLLMGARGNSGVILSQLFRGFAKAVEGKESINTDEFAKAFQAGVDTAYKAVMKPVEGTILTVAKDAAKKAVKTAKSTDDLTIVMEEMVKEAKESLKRTPELLPVLKEVGVVDSGGQGLVFIYEGFLAELKGEKISESPKLPSMDKLVSAEHHKNAQSHINTEDIKYGYCTEFMVRFEKEKEPFSEKKFREDLSRFGDSLLVIADDELVKVHIHSEQPGEVLTYGQRYGSLLNMKIENMREQHSTIVNNQTENVLSTEPAAPKNAKYGIIAVAMGSGISDLFTSIGATKIIEGGQTMNPSTEDFVKAVEQLNAENIIILPNNSNIIMAANQAAQITDKNIRVIETKSVPQGLSALLAFNPELGLEENVKAMEEASRNVKTGQVTYAVRDTSIDGLAIEKGDFMGIYEKTIVAKDKSKLEAAKKLLDQMIDEEDEILTILQGEDASENEVDQLVQHVENHYEHIEIEVHNGNQPLYSYIFSVE